MGLSMRRAEPRLEVGGVPRVDLLPPEVRARRQDARVTRMLLLVLVAAVVLAGAGVLGAKVVADGSASRLAAAQARTAQLLAAQRRYAVVSSAQSRLAATRAARTTVAGHVIDWRGYLRAVSATLPSGVHVVAATAESADAAAAPGSAPTTAAAPTGTVATLTLQVRTPRWNDVQDWLTALPALRGFLDASPTTVARDPQAGVTATVVVHVGEKAYGAPVADTTAVPAASTVTPTPTPTPTPSAPALGTTQGSVPASSPPPTVGSTTAPTPSATASSPAPLAAGTSGGDG